MKGNVELLESASKYGRNVKHITVTGSINALTMGMPDEIKDHVFTTEEYNHVPSFMFNLTFRLRLKMREKLRILM